jgi:hypothetical protein
MSSTTNLKLENANTLSNIMDNRIARHSLGRLDSAVKTLGLAIITILQFGKVLLTGTVATITAGRLEAKWNFNGALFEDTMLALCAYKTSCAFRDMIAAPNAGYTSTLPTMVEGFNILRGKPADKWFVNTDKFTLQNAAEIINGYVSKHPFFANILDANN